MHSGGHGIMSLYILTMHLNMHLCMLFTCSDDMMIFFQEKCVWMHSRPKDDYFLEKHAVS